MTSFAIWYKRNPTFWPDPHLTAANLGETHVMLRILQAEDREDAFMTMQGCIWSPNGEARPLIEKKGLRHTSMSVGDVLHRLEDNAFFEVMPGGWRRLPE